MTNEKYKITKTSFVIPFTPFNWGDYAADTSHLTYEEHGTYWNLLRRYYTTGPFEIDMKSLQRFTRCPNERMVELENILKEFFFISIDDCWHHKRCDEEIMKVKNVSEIQSKKARQGIVSRERDAAGKFAAKSKKMIDEYSPATAGECPAINTKNNSNNKYKDEYQDKYINNEYSINNQDVKQRFEELRQRMNIEE